MITESREAELLGRIQELEARLTAAEIPVKGWWPGEHKHVLLALQREYGMNNYDMAHTLGIGINSFIRGALGVERLNLMSPVEAVKAREIRDELIKLVHAYRPRKNGGVTA